MPKTEHQPMTKPGTNEWQPIDTDPNDGKFRLYGLHVQDAGHSWFEVHYVAQDDGGQMILPCGDNFDDWALSDFEVWADAPSYPTLYELLAADPPCQNAGQPYVRADGGCLRCNADAGEVCRIPITAPLREG